MRFLTLAVYIASASALGINCRGSFLCAPGAGLIKDLQAQIGDMIASGNGGRFFNEHEQIACALGRLSTVCAFFQKGASGTAQDAFNHVQHLIDHGCVSCGSDPTQDGNDVNTGELTINAVSEPCCTTGNCQC